MDLSDETNANIFAHAYALTLAGQIVMICDRERKRVTGRRIEDVLRRLTPEGDPAAPQFDALRELVEVKVANILEASAALK